jgi:hypothetical protein
MSRLTLFTLLSIALMAACTPAASSIARITPLPAQERPLSAADIDAKAQLVASDATPTLVATLSPLERLAAQAPTPTPLSADLPLGSAMLIAAATDTAMRPTPRTPVTFADSPVAITFDEFYDGYNLRTGLVLSDKLVALDGQRVVMQGYMAPPLKAELDYFVLTRVRLAFCPFCTNASDWPNDIALVYLTEGSTISTDAPVRLTGRMEIGTSVDPETGMVSLVRIYADAMETLP